MKPPLFSLLRVMCVLVLATLCLGILVNSGYWNIAVSSFRGEFKNQRSSMIKMECFVSFFFFFTFYYLVSVSLSVCLYHCLSVFLIFIQSTSIQGMQKSCASVSHILFVVVVVVSVQIIVPHHEE